jgi:predicted ester cyclase
MPFIRDPLLVVWEAMNLLAEADRYPDAPQIKRLVADAEEVLCRLTMELMRRAELQDLSEPRSSKIVFH